MFKANHKYRHNNCFDIDIIPKSTPVEKEDRYMLDVIYWNRHYNFTCFYSPETVSIKKEDLDFWKEVQ